MTRTTGKHRAAIVISVALALVTIAGPASAAWKALGGGASAVKAANMPSGAAPTVSVSGRNVSLTWAVRAFPDGKPLNGYTIKRYDNGAVVQTVESGCAGTIATVSCTEAAVPPGTWRYSVTPLHGNWIGSESPFSTAVTVGPPTLTFTSPTTLKSLPATLSGNVTNFITGESVTFRLDDPSTGALLSGSATPSSIPTSGSSAIIVTIPTGTSNGSHTVYAIGNQGNVAAGAFIVDSPRPLSLSINNGGTLAGTPERGDSIVIGFSERLSVMSLCSTWSNDNANQSISAINVVSATIRNNAAVSGNDLLVVTTTSAACGGSFRFGSIDLGSAQFVIGTGDAVFSGGSGNASTISWNATSFELTIRLGTKSIGTGTVAVVTAATTATYSPAVGITSSGGNAVTGAVSSTRIQF